jgi:N-acetylmuramoyl-L-alanine amidase
MNLNPNQLDPNALAEGRVLLTRLPTLSADESLRGIIGHWTAGSYTTTYPDSPIVNGDNDGYHVCVALSGHGWLAMLTADPRLNAIQVSGNAPYMAHAYEDNSHMVGIAACCMADATVSDFGSYPIQEHQVHVLCAVAAAFGVKYGIDVSSPDGFRSHGEDAIRFGYFGERTDLCYFETQDHAVTQDEAAQRGDLIRALAHAYKLELMKSA